MLTPVDIQNKNFKGGIGFDKKDVESFMNELASDYSMLYRSNVELKDKVNTLNESLQHYKSIEDSMQKALTISEKTSEETVNAAQDKARQITTEAELKAESILADAKQELEDIRNEIYRLQEQQKTFKEQFTKILNAELKMLDGEIINIDLGADFEPSVSSSGSSFSSGFSESGLGSEGGLGGGGGYTGNNPSNFDKPAQEPAFDRGSSLNMDPFAGGEGRFSSKTGGDYTGSSKKKDNKKSEKNTTSLNIKNNNNDSKKIHRVPTQTSSNAQVNNSNSNDSSGLNLSSEKTEVKKRPTMSPLNKANIKSSSDIEQGASSRQTFQPQAEPVSKPAPKSAMEQRLAAQQMAAEAAANESLEGEIESKFKESNMIDSEDNYSTGFDFMTEDTSSDNYSSNETFYDENETYSGEVESKVNESNMIDSEDNYNTGFDFVVGNESEEEIPTINGSGFTQSSSLNINPFNDDDDDNSVFVGDVEDKATVNESHMIGNDDDDNEGFNFM